MRHDLPSGTVTFLFTDVEGSTKLLHKLGVEAYAEELAEHRSVVREACGARGGVEVDTQGDAFFVAFPTAPAAVEAARVITDGLASGLIALRIGLHTGTPLLTDEGYIGEDVHFAARVAASAHGGQVVLSNATRVLLNGRYPLIELGEHRLKDIADPVAIFQLGDGQFPPLKTISNTNLPRPASSFVGRERELQEVLARIEDGGRLLTLTGPGGSGKTRLALEAAMSLVSEYKAGVFWIGLASLRDPTLVTETIAQTLGAKDGLVEHICEREMLLLLDNLEQLIDAAPDLSSLLQACPNLTLLVTSRELLRVQGEIDYPVPPLAEVDAVSLFSERAQRAASEEISELCRRLDNLPLAVELAAARTKALSPAQILERLSQRLDLLKGGRDADPRQQTLRATIEWSYDLLSDEERTLFARLAVFAGGCRLEAAEAVCDPQGEHDVGLLDWLQSLVEKSLLRHDEGTDGEPRFWMLATIREYAHERLDRSPDAEAVRRRHAEYFRRLSEEAGEHLRGGNEKAGWNARLEEEHSDLQAALAFWRCDPDSELVIAANAWMAWLAQGRWSEARHWLEEALAGTDQATPTRLNALFGAYYLAYVQGETARAREFLEEVLALARRLDDRESIADALQGLANVALEEGDDDHARALAEESLSINEDAVPLFLLGWLAFIHGRYGTARAYLERALSHSRTVEDEAPAPYDLASLAIVAVYEGDEQRAESLLEEAMRDARDFGDKAALINWCLPALAVLRSASGDAGGAARLVGAWEALRRTELGSPGGRIARELKERILAPARTQLDDAALAEAVEEGQSLSLDEALVHGGQTDSPTSAADRETVVTAGK